MDIQINFWNGKEPLHIEAENTKDALEEAVKAGANLRGADLIDANLIDADLIGANLIGAKRGGKNSGQIVQFCSLDPVGRFRAQR